MSLGVRLVIPHEPWRRYRFRRFVFCSGEKPVMMTHPKLGLVTVQEYYEQEYNYQIQLPHMPLLVVVHKKQVRLGSASDDRVSCTPL